MTELLNVRQVLDGTVSVFVTPSEGCVIKNLYIETLQGQCFIVGENYTPTVHDYCIPEGTKTQKICSDTSPVCTDGSVPVKLMGVQDLKILIRKGKVTITNV